MPMPMNFRYKEVLQRGRPIHQKWDDFLDKTPADGCFTLGKDLQPI